MSSTSAASWSFATLNRLEGGSTSAGSSLRGSITPINSRPVSPEVIKVNAPLPPGTRSQNSSISSTGTMVDPRSLPPVTTESQPVPLPTTMYGFHLPRPQAGRARTYSLTIAAEQAAQEQASLRSSIPLPAADYFVASHRTSQSAVIPSPASALDHFQQQHHKLTPPRCPVSSPSPTSTHSSRMSLIGSETRIVNSGFIVTRPRSGSSSDLEPSRPRSGSSSASPVDPVLMRTSVGPSWHQKRMQRMVSSGSLDKLASLEFSSREAR